MGGISDSSIGLVQTVVDNFDCNISSQNGLKSTHSLAVLLTQSQQGGSEDSRETSIRRLEKPDMKSEVPPDVSMQCYKGPKKPQMPENERKPCVLPLRFLASQKVILTRAQTIDAQFLNDIVTDSATPEFGGYNTKTCRDQVHAVKPATKVLYKPLIDMVPSDPSTILTAMYEAQKDTRETGQTFTVMTADQQLYRVMVRVMWAYPKLFETFIPRLGGMHMLMSFVGCVWTLMADTGLKEIMESAFAGVSKMLSGKKFPQNVRALRFVAEELLRPISVKSASYDEMMSKLEEMSRASRTTKLWVDCLIRPVLIMMLFVRAERESEWPLHMKALNMMMPYFFAAGHINYARYGLYYLSSMEKLPPHVLIKFMKGEHVMRHQAGLWNGMWSDMFIETTFMRYGHGPGGLVGITLKQTL